jgi:thioredoxin reductase (NADPH)
LFKGRAVAVAGGGDSALGEALYLSRLCSKVYLIHRREEFRAARVLQDRVRAAPNVEVVLNGLILEVIGENRVEGLTLRDKVSNRTHRFDVSGLFVYVGSCPNTQFLVGIVELDKEGYVITDPGMQTSNPLIFACGDCRSKILRQVSTAVSDGALAAVSVERKLSSEQ